MAGNERDGEECIRNNKKIEKLINIEKIHKLNFLK